MEATVQTSPAIPRARGAVSMQAVCDAVGKDVVGAADGIDSQAS